MVVSVANGWATTASPQSKNRSPSGPTTMLPPWRSSCWIEAGTPDAATRAGELTDLGQSRRQRRAGSVGVGAVVRAGRVPRSRRRRAAVRAPRAADPAVHPESRRRASRRSQPGLDRALQLRVFGEDPLPGRRDRGRRGRPVASRGASGRRHRTGSSRVPARRPVAGRLGGRPGRGTPTAAGLRRRGPDRSPSAMRCRHRSGSGEPWTTAGHGVARRGR